MKIPKKYHGLLESKDIAFIGLSLGKQEFINKKVMEGYIDFLTKDFNKSFLLNFRIVIVMMSHIVIVRSS